MWEWSSLSREGTELLLITSFVSVWNPLVTVFYGSMLLIFPNFHFSFVYQPFVSYSYIAASMFHKNLVTFSPSDSFWTFIFVTAFSFVVHKIFYFKRKKTLHHLMHFYFIFIYFMYFWIEAKMQYSCLYKQIAWIE